MSNLWYCAYVKNYALGAPHWAIFRQKPGIGETSRATKDEAKIAHIIKSLNAEGSIPKYELDFLLKERDRLLQQYPEYFV